MRQRLSVWLTSTRPPDVGKRYLCVALAAGVVTLTSALFMQVELLAAESSFAPAFYNQLFTIHGASGLFGFSMWILLPTFGNLVLPATLRVSDVAWPRINAATFWLWLVSLLLLGGTLLEQAAIPATLSAATMLIWATLVVANLGATVWRHRSRAQSLPLFGVSILCIALLSVFAWLSGLAQWLMGGPGLDGLVAGARDAMLALVPGLVLGPAIGLTSDILEARHGGLCGRRWIHASIAWIVLGSALPPHWLGELTSLVVVIGLVGAWTRTMLRAGPPGRRLAEAAPEAIWIAGLLPTILIAEVTRVVLRSLSVDVHIHDSYFAVGRLHYMASCGVIALAAGLFAHWPALAKREPALRLGQVGAVLSIVGLQVAFFCHFVLGHRGMPRRYQAYASMFESLFRLSASGVFVLLLGLLASVLSLTVFSRAQAVGSRWRR